jgi:hypothetical protein
MVAVAGVAVGSSIAGQYDDGASTRGAQEYAPHSRIASADHHQLLVLKDPNRVVLDLDGVG